MAYDRPFYRRTTEKPTERYSTRLLLGFLASLTGLVLLLHLPVSPSPPPRIGWTTRPAERIALSAVQHEGESREQPTVPKGAPPPTRHGTGDAASSTGDPDGQGTGGPTLPEPPAEDDSESPPVRAVTTLSAEDETPEIRGGMGAFYLHIQYPPEARRQGIEGQLELRFTVGTDGSVRRVRVTKSLHPLCDSAAVQALRSVTFVPGTHDGEPVPVRMSLPVRFVLRSAPNPLRPTQLPSSSS